ncbi:MAG: helix-turn-helix transcriptional regulator [Pseudomonadota bacterium]
MSDDTRSLILDVYDTVADPSLWQGVLDRFAKALDAKGFVIFELNGYGDDRVLSASHYSSYHQPDLLQAYIDVYREWELKDQDTFEAHSLAADGIDLIDDSVLATSDEELFKIPNAAQLLDYGIRHRHAGLLNKDNTTRSRFSVQLAADRGRLTPEEQDRMRIVLPHIAKALDLGRPAARLVAEHRGMIEAMDRLRIGVCILDATGRAITTNQEFDRQRDAYGAFRVDHDGRLRLHDEADHGQFQALMQDAFNHGKHGARPRKEAVPISRDGESGALSVELVPIENIAEMGSTRLDGVILYSLDTSQPVQCDSTLLRHIYGLTGAESQLIEMLSEGLTNAEIAERRARSVATVNAQIKSLLSKTQCTNRTQLVRLLMDFGVDYLVAPRMAV